MFKKLKFNQNGFLLITVFIIVAIIGIISGAVWYIIKQNNETSSSMVVTEKNNLCSGLSEGECFSKLSNCIDASSNDNFVNKFLKKEKIDRLTSGPGQGKDLLNFKPELTTNFTNAEYYTYRLLQGGGDATDWSFIRYKNKYCPIDIVNSKYIFGPIKNKLNALEYYRFISNTSSSTAVETYIMKTADYSGTDNNIPHNDRLKICFSKNMVILSGKVTQIDDLANSYILNLVIFDPMGEGRVYENKVIVKYDGSIQEVSMNKLISSCDEGQMVF